MYAIIDLQGHQYIVKKGDKIVVDRLDNEQDEEFIAENILAIFDEDGENIKIGSPFIEKTHVKFKIIENNKGEKIDVIKFKRKNRYQRKYGFRPYQTILLVDEINII